MSSWLSPQMRIGTALKSGCESIILLRQVSPSARLLASASLLVWPWPKYAPPRIISYPSGPTITKPSVPTPLLDPPSNCIWMKGPGCKRDPRGIAVPRKEGAMVKTASSSSNRLAAKDLQSGCSAQFTCAGTTDVVVTSLGL